MVFLRESVLIIPYLRAVYKHSLLDRVFCRFERKAISSLLGFRECFPICLVSKRIVKECAVTNENESCLCSSFSMLIGWPVASVIGGVITRSISVTVDAIVLGYTLWKTFYIFQIDREARSTTKLTTALAYNGNTQLLCNILLLLKHFNR